MAEYRTDRRGYLLVLKQDLFGAFVLYRRWYGLHNRRGGFKRQVFTEEAAALKEMQRIEKRRLWEGYRKLERPTSKALSFFTHCPPSGGTSRTTDS